MVLVSSVDTPCLFISYGTYDAPHPPAVFSTALRLFHRAANEKQGCFLEQWEQPEVKEANWIFFNNSSGWFNNSKSLVSLHRLEVFTYRGNEDCVYAFQ